MRPSHPSAALDGAQVDGVSEESPHLSPESPGVGRRARANSSSLQVAGSPSVSQRTPARSFYHRSFHGSLGMLISELLVLRPDLCFQTQLTTPPWAYGSRRQNWHLWPYLTPLSTTHLISIPDGTLSLNLKPLLPVLTPHKLHLLSPAGMPIHGRVPRPFERCQNQSLSNRVRSLLRLSNSLRR